VKTPRDELARRFPVNARADTLVQVRSLARTIWILVFLGGCSERRLAADPPGAGSAGREGNGAQSTGTAGAPGESSGAVTGGSIAAGAGGNAPVGPGGPPTDLDAGGSTLAPDGGTCLNGFGLGRGLGLHPEEILDAGPAVFGTPALPNEQMTATLDGVPVSFSTSFYELTNDARNAMLFGYGEHGELGLTAFALTPGTYSCPSVAIAYGALVSNGCCQIEVTKAGEVGDTIEGTFSGIVGDQAGGRAVKVENGTFKVVRRAPSAEGETAADASSLAP
jgi:hypothetical protein